MKSRLYLPKLKLQPLTILEHLIAQFPHVSPETWRDRVARGVVRLNDGSVLRQESAYRPGATVYYEKEADAEPEAVDEEVIIYRDENILVVDKPHGMPVTPAGQHIERSLVARLQRRLGMESLTPAHRLDRDTAGIVLMVIHAEARGKYQKLFEDRR
jgi:tRNA pseudouridine32 synthase / 23S rRNA pseudouridine746 synthase